MPSKLTLNYTNFNILIVDDNPINLKILKSILLKEGYKVKSALNGPEARKLAIDTHPDLIILDIMMPGEDGFSVVKSLKKDSKTASIPVIFLTAIGEIDSKKACFDLGAVDYITKPFHPEEILARVRVHLKLSLAINSLIATQAKKLMQIQEAQTSFLISPEELPSGRFSVYYKALNEAGGDFYDVLPIAEDIFAYFIADVSGHDIGTSYITAAVKALLKQNCSPIYKPLESMRMINKVLLEILPQGKYLTACYTKLNRKKGIMSIVNAGHPPAIYLPYNDKARFVEIEGDVLGIFSDVHYEQHDIDVERGDRFFLYTDGLIEDAERLKVWTEGLDLLLNKCNLVRNTPLNKSAHLLKQLLMETTKAHDDIVVMGIEV